MGNDLRARVQTLARLRRGRIGVSDRWDSSGGTARDNYLTGAPYSRQFGLCARRERPRDDRAAEQRDEVAALHSITSSACCRNGSGMARPSAFAVLRLTISSNLVGSWTGKSPGLAPLRIRSTYDAARR